MPNHSGPSLLTDRLTLKANHHRNGYGLCLFCIGMAVAVQYMASKFLEYGPDDVHLIEKVNQLQAWTYPLLICSLIPLYFALRNFLLLNDAGISLRRWGRWRFYSWTVLSSADVRYCPECRCLQIDDGRQAFKFSLCPLSDDDRNRFFDQLALGGVAAEPFVRGQVHRLHPWWSGTSYEFSDRGIAVVKKGERREFTWDEIPSACVLYAHGGGTAVRAVSVELGDETVQLCHQCCSLRGESACHCSIFRPVIALLQSHLDPARLTVTQISRSLEDLETDADLDRYEQHHRAGLWELRVAFRIIGGFFALLGMIGAVVGAFQLDTQPHGSWFWLLYGWSVTVGFGALLAFGVPYLTERAILSPIKARRRELVERALSRPAAHADVPGIETR